MKRILAIICCLGLLVGMVAGCGGSTETEQPAGDSEKQSLVVGATAKPHAEILEVVQPMLEKKNIDLEIKNDRLCFVECLSQMGRYANFFQHIPHLEDFNEKIILIWSDG